MIQDFIRRVAEVEGHRARSINMIPSENRMSPLARRLLAIEAGSRYFFEGSDPPAFLGGAADAELQLDGKRLLGRLGRARHVNMRPLSGLHAMTVLMSALTKPGDAILSLSPGSGGHYATGPLAERMGRIHGTFALTPDQALSEEALADGLRRHRPSLLYVDQCHGLFPVDIRRIVTVAREVSPDTLIHADVSHGLGLVLGGVLDNPLEAGCNSYGGSTHKTFPGPQKGVLLTDDANIADRIAAAQFHLTSNHHLNAALSLSAALWEFAECGGAAYAASIPITSARLGRALSEHGIFPVQIGGRHSGWHQLWIPESGLPLDAQSCATRLAQAGIMVNALPDLPGLASFALRLGVSEISHLGFSAEATNRLAALIGEILHGDGIVASFRPRVAELLASATCPYDHRPEEDLLWQLPETGGRGALCVPWSPITPPVETPIFVAGRGAYVMDREGNSWLDAKSGALNATLGYGRADIAEAARDQLLRLMSSDAVGALNAPSLALAHRISLLTRGALPHTLFCNSGSEAAEAALKIGLIFQQTAGHAERQRIVAFENSYHGCTMGALALTQLDFPKAGLEWLPKTLAIPMPVPRANGENWGAIRALIEGPEGHKIAAIILEPVQGIGGIRPFPDDYLAELRRMCDRTGVLLIMDEVFTGFGRTGLMFAYEHSGAVPDILMTSKGLTAGYAPLSAVSMSERVFRGVAKDPHLGGLRHGHTMSGNAAACAVALRVLDVLEAEDVLGNTRRMGDRLLVRLSALMAARDVVEVRGRGLMIGIELTSDELTAHVVDVCRDLGLLVRAQAGAVQIVPPLTISVGEADRIAEVVEAGVLRATGTAV